MNVGPSAPPELRIRLARPTAGEEELEAVGRVLASGQLTNGPEVEAFEQEFADLHGVEHAVAMANGTVALAAIYLALGIGPGDEVIVPSLTFVSSVTSILHAGARPVFAEVDPATYNLDPDDVSRRITPRTKAVLAVHYGGQPAPLRPLGDLTEEAGIHLIEDAAQAHGASYDGVPVGGWGVAGMFSFTPTKNMTTGEGGMVTTHHRSLAHQLRLLRNHGQTALYRHELLGWNWRLSDIQAAVGRVQLRRLPEIIERKRANASWMGDRLKSIGGVHPPTLLPGAKGVFMLYTLWVDHGRDGVLEHLLSEGIEGRVYFPPVHRQALFDNLAVRLPVTEEVAEHILSIPFHAQLAIRDLDDVASCLRRAVGL
ncbi:MAG: DegT/DnrJ/EryC1/StrS family aminotransferase [Acidimicrobiales bacterium]